jgi:DNA primase
MLLQRLDDPGEDEGASSAELGQLTAITQFLASATAPRRSSTFPDLRDSLGKA